MTQTVKSMRTAEPSHESANTPQVEIKMSKILDARPDILDVVIKCIDSKVIQNPPMFKDYSNSRITVRYTRRYSLTFIAPMDILRAVDCVVGNDMPGVYLLAPSVYENWNGSRHPESKNFTTEQISGTGDAMLALVQVFRGLELSKRIPKGVKLTKLDEHQLSESVQAELECKFEPKPIALIKTGYMAKLYETRAIAFNVFEGLINALKHGSAVISVNRTRE